MRVADGGSQACPTGHAVKDDRRAFTRLPRRDEFRLVIPALSRDLLDWLVIGPRAIAGAFFPLSLFLNSSITLDNNRI